MKELRSKLIAVSLVCLFAVSAASCQSENPDGTSTTVVTNSADDNNNDNNSSNDNNNNDSNDNAAVSEAPVPEKDDDGSKISVIEVTDSNNAPVTNKNGSKVTEIAIVNDKGQVITDAKGNNVKPNIKVTTKADRIVETKATEKNNAGGNNANNDNNNNNNSNNNENNNSNSNIKHSAEGPTLSLPEKLEAKAGETVTFKVPVTGNTGYTGLIAWIDIDENYFEFVSYDGGDTDDSNNDFSKEYNNTTFNPYKKPNADGTSTLVCMYFDASCESLVGNTTYATITLKVKDNTPAGEYKLEFDAATDGKAQCNNVNANKDIIVATPTYKNGSIIVK